MESKKRRSIPMPRETIFGGEENPTDIVYWVWEEAFDKFGFADGDGWNGTDIVAAFIEEHGYETECDTWGCHNYMIWDIKRAGASIIPDGVKVGYTDPRLWIPKTLQQKLDKEFRGDRLLPAKTLKHAALRLSMKQGW